MMKNAGALELGGSARGNALTARLFTTDESNDYLNRPDSARFVNFETQAVTTGFQLQDVVRVRGQQLVVGVDYTGQRATSRSPRTSVPGSAGGGAGTKPSRS